MLFWKEVKKTGVHVVYLVFICLLLFEWYRNFYGVTQKEIAGAGNLQNYQEANPMGGSVLRRPREGDAYYGSTQEDAPDKIMAGAADRLQMEYRANSYATYPFGYYKEVRLDEKEQACILDILQELTGLSEKELQNLPTGYFPAVNGNIFHAGAGVTEEDGSFVIKPDAQEADGEQSGDFGQQFVPQVSYERFWELMREAEDVIGKGSNYSEETLKMYFGQGEMEYEEAVEEYERTVYEDKITTAFARLFCDYMTRPICLYAVFLAVWVCLADQRYGVRELADSKRMGTGKLILERFAAMLFLILTPVLALSLESWAPLMAYAAECGIAADGWAFLKYIAWWLLPSAMVVLALGMFLTEWTKTPVAIAVGCVWWFLDSGTTGLSGDVKPFTLMIRHNTLRGSELVRENIGMIWLNRGILVFGSILFLGAACVVYEKRREGAWKDAGIVRKYLGFLKMDFKIAFGRSVPLAVVYLMCVPLVRGIRNLNTMQSAECLVQSVSLVGVILIVPVLRGELSGGIREIVVGRVWGYWRTVWIRMGVALGVTAGMIGVFAVVMQRGNCVFLFWETTLWVMGFSWGVGIVGVLAAWVGKSVAVGYLAAVGCWEVGKMFL